MLASIFEQISEQKNLTPIRIVFFSNAVSDEAIAQQRPIIRTAVEDHFKDQQPTWSAIAQAPICSNSVDAVAGFTYQVAAEVCFVESNTPNIAFRKFEDMPYVTIKNETSKQLFVSGVVNEDDAVINDQCIVIFEKISKLLSLEEMPINSIVRQWNYIPHIVSTVENFQNYQQFNDARSTFYNQTQWTEGYPAATGIGTLCGKVTVDLDASVGQKVTPIDNKLQIAAHVYSQDVLIGKEEVVKTTPKFERAKTVDSWLYVSGTASIRGEESIGWDDIKTQTEVTLDNIEHLIEQAGSQPMNSLRAYLKKAEFAEVSKDIVASQNPGTEAIYVVSDVCRDELLIEIEANADIN